LNENELKCSTKKKAEKSVYNLMQSNLWLTDNNNKKRPTKRCHDKNWWQKDVIVTHR